MGAAQDPDHDTANDAAEQAGYQRSPGRMSDTQTQRDGDKKHRETCGAVLDQVIHSVSFDVL
jgi:hypothetical protein